MNGRRCTPQSTHKTSSSASKFHTPTQLNLTLREHGTSISKSARHGFKSASHLDLVNLGHSQPHIRQNLINIDARQDHEAECDLTYSDYLQSFMKQQIIGEVIQNHQEDLLYQVSIQNDKLFRGKMKCQKSVQELGKLEKFKEVEDLVNCLSNNVESFYQCNEMCDLEETLGKLLKLLEYASNSVNVKNVKKIQEKDLKKLETSLKECSTVVNKMDLDRRNAAEIHSLSSIMKKYQQITNRANERQKSLQKAQKNELFKLLKAVSDMYADKEKHIF